MINNPCFVFAMQMLAYYAFHPNDVMQRNMTIKAYPCNNPLCMNPDHLFLCEDKKIRMKELESLGSKGKECIRRSQVSYPLSLLSLYPFSLSFLSLLSLLSLFSISILSSLSSLSSLYLYSLLLSLIISLIYLHASISSLVFCIVIAADGAGEKSNRTRGQGSDHRHAHCYDKHFAIRKHE